MRSLSRREAMMLGVSVVLGVVVLSYHFFVGGWIEHWGQIRGEIAVFEAKIGKLDVKGSSKAAARAAALQKAVPAFAMPEAENEQRLLFEKKFYEQLKQAGVKAENLRFDTKGQLDRTLGLRLLKMHCKGRCKFTQAMDLLANLNSNPYLVSVEEFTMTIDEKKPQEVEVELVLTTYVR